MKRFLGPEPLDKNFAALLLRILVGGLMIIHGWPKLANYDQYVTEFNPIGLGNDLSLSLAIFGEFICGIFILLGFMTRLAAIPVLITMIVAFFVVHGADEFQVKELSFVYMGLALVVFFLGSGKYSADAVLFRKKALE
ncbi:DoxX family protein [uncultured Flavobacterium sp.]|uniref:DoxX family protein n=1 Tax=uncultured Flavobacterium sp. TaxID=165435 RepID=UPI0025FB9FCC|nr:DoxX family protein [uncultured Flavobacterium sp.]